VSVAHFTLDRLARLKAKSVDSAMAWLASTTDMASVEPLGIQRRALFSCMIEQSLPVPTALLGAHTLLLIDDEPAVLRSLSRVLRQAAPDLKLLVAEGAIEGLSQAVALQPDAILVDAYMPEKSGVSVCAELRAATATEHIKVLAMTADPTPELAAAFARAGAVAFLEKPIDVPALFEVLSGQLVPSAGDW
jgi:CheY-like chemotaxis protein